MINPVDMVARIATINHLRSYISSNPSVCEKKPNILSNSRINPNTITISSIQRSITRSVITVPKENYEQFRAVINAAADFNKKVLVFEKIK